MQKYTAHAQERSCILSIDKEKLKVLFGSKLQVEKQERLDFIKGINIFKNVSLFSLLPISNKLTIKKFKLGQPILLAGKVPQGLYIIQKGFCKVGIIKNVAYHVDGLEDSWCRPKPKPFRHADNMTDPLPLSREGIEEYDHEPAYPL